MLHMAYIFANLRHRRVVLLREVYTRRNLVLGTVEKETETWKQECLRKIEMGSLFIK